MPLLASASVESGIGNSATATSIESFEAFVGSQKVERRNAMDLKLNDFSKKLIFHTFQYSFKTGSSLSRDAIPLIIRNDIYENIFIEIFWISYHHFAVLSTEHEKEKSVMENRIRKLWEKFKANAKKRLCKDALKKLFDIMPEFTAIVVSEALSQLFPASKQFLNLLNYKEAIKKLANSILSKKWKTRQSTELSRSAPLYSSSFTEHGKNSFSKSLYAYENRIQSLRKNVGHRSAKRKGQYLQSSINQNIRSVKSNETKRGGFDLSKYFQERVQTSSSLPSLSTSISSEIRTQNWQIGFHGACLGKFGSDYVWRMNDSSTYLTQTTLDDKSLNIICGMKNREERRLRKLKQKKDWLCLDRAERKKKYLDTSLEIDDVAARENYDEDSDDDYEGEPDAGNSKISMGIRKKEKNRGENGLEGQLSNNYEIMKIKNRIKNKTLDWCMSLYKNHRKVPKISDVPGRELLSNLKVQKAERMKAAQEYERIRFLN